MEADFIYFDAKRAIAVHDWIIDHSGGMKGIKDHGQVESILEHVQNEFYYPSFEEKLTHIIFSFIKFHAFNDGNKRSGIALGAYFLTLNGYEYAVPLFVKELENIAVWVAEGKIDKEFLQVIVAEIMTDLEISDASKLKMITVILEK